MRLCRVRKARSAHAESVPDATKKSSRLGGREMAQNDKAKNITETGAPADGSTVSVQGPRYDDEVLLSLDSFDAAVALAQQTFGGELVKAEETLGNGFTILNGEAKNVLCGVPLVFLGWNFNVGDQGEFVSAQVVARMPGGGMLKAIINDGGTGIFKQLGEFTDRNNGQMGGLFARGGLTRSDYKYKDEVTGEERPATTFYINTSAS